MSDLISRQDALNALGEEPHVWTHSEYEIAERSQWRSDVEAIKGVPPARQWTPCSEKLPDYGQRVLGTFKLAYGNICRTTVRIKFHGNDVWLAGLGDDPIAWCEIPEPYEGG